MESESLDINKTGNSLVIDFHKDFYILQDGFINYLCQIIFNYLLENDSFLKTNLILDILSEGLLYSKKLEDIRIKIEFEEKRYSSKTLQECNATLRHLREDKEKLEKDLKNNKAYQKFLNFNFKNLCNKINDISESMLAEKKHNKEFYGNIEKRFKSQLLSALQRLFSINSSEICVKPVLSYKKSFVELSFDIFEKEQIIDFSGILLKQTVFDSYNKIPENLRNIKIKADIKSETPEYLKKINDSQRYATIYPLEHILVLAGAGCGKTTTIISRAAYLISQGIPPERILILTFTRKAAFEIVSRIDNCIRKISYGLKAATFHRWCMDILKAYPNIFGYENFTFIDRDEQLQIFKRIRTACKNNALPRAAKLLDTYSFSRNTEKRLTDVIYFQLFDYLFEKDEIIEMMRAYEKEKQIKNYLDYDDILDIVASTIKQNKDVCEWLGRKYDCILVDEMQDTNPLQWTLLEPLSKYTKLFCVGDDAQAIYSFRGADFENIHSFQERIPNSVIIKLEDNYRSTQEILDLSNWLLKTSKIKYDKELKAALGYGEKPRLHTFLNIYDECAWIAKDLLQRYKEDNIWHNKLVLVRSAFSGRNIEVECLRNNIPYIFIGGQKLLESAHVKDLLSLLRISENYKDELAWYRFLTLFPGVGDVTANKLIKKIIDCNKIEDVNKLLNSMVIETFGLKTIYLELLKETDLESKINASINFLDDILMYKYGKNDWPSRKKDFVYLKQLSENYNNMKEFVEEFMLDPVFSSQKNSLEEKEYVTISTIHSAKGTENDIVYITDVSVGRYPSLRDISSMDEIEEERRVLYVAMTRAKKELIITRSIYIPSDWIDENMTLGLQVQYFLKNLPESLIRESRHRAQENYIEKNVFLKKSEKMQLPEQYKVRISSYTRPIGKDATNKIKVELTNEELEMKKLYECSKISIEPLLEMIKESGKMKRALASEIGVGRNYLDNLTNQTKPLFETIKKFSNYFKVSPDACFKITEKGNISRDEANPMIIEYMKKRIPGDPYPSEIKEAVISEYVPNVYGFKKIGAKYGINPDVIIGWTKFKK